MGWLANRLQRWTVGLKNRVAERWISEEEDLARSLAELDAEQPGWDSTSELRLAYARDALQRGRPESHVAALYGQETVDAAKLELQPVEGA